mmetsp:Transcript_5032/g.14290  ORF Transcript_5032/g.14290 Transcript_5032/m.14290 type:complete len:383 (+) Transcript_5032:116-1264(+)
MKGSRHYLCPLCNRLFKHFKGLVDLGFVHDERRDEADDTGTSGDEQKSFLHDISDELTGSTSSIVLDNNATKETPSTDLTKNIGVFFGNLDQTRSDLFSAGLHVVQQIIVGHVLGDGHTGGASQGVATVRRGVSSRGQHIGGGAARHHGTNGNATAQCFGRGEDIGLNAKLLMAPEMSTASHTNLNLIAHEQSAGIVGQLASRLEELRISGDDTTFALEGLHQDGGKATLPSLGIGGCVDLLDLGLEGLDVVVGDVLKARDHLPSVSEAGMVLRLSGGRKSGQGAAMEGLDGRNDDGTIDAAIVGVLPGQLDGTFVGLGPAVAEEDLVGAGVIGEPSGQLSLLRVEVEVGNVMELFHLGRNGGGQLGVAVAEGAGGNSRDKI